MLFLIPMLAGAMGAGTLATAGIGALAGAASASMAGAKGSDLFGAAALGALSGGMGGSLMSGAAQIGADAAAQTALGATTEAGLAAGSNAAMGGAGATLNGAMPGGIAGLGGMSPGTGNAALQALGDPNASMAGLQAMGLNPGITPSLGAQGMMPEAFAGASRFGEGASAAAAAGAGEAAAPSAWDSISSNLSNTGRGLESPEFWKSAGMIRPMMMAQAEGGIHDIGVAAQQKAKQDEYKKRMRSRYSFSPYEKARFTGAEGGEVPELARGVRQGQIERALAEAEGRKTNAPRPVVPTAASDVNFFKPRGKPKESQAEAAARIRAQKPKPYAAGGIASMPNTTMTGRFLAGKTGGQSDRVAAMIDGKVPAAIAHGEFIVPADVVAMLGEGNSEAGAEQLHEMLDRIRVGATGQKKQIKRVNPRKVLPA